ncbi:MAG: hypothetical protein KF765_12195 [Parvibaculaceae bacterium]|nr:hypothetical protein [Parvibaculaceae bacterium]
MATELENKIAQFETDLGLAHDIVHGDDETTVETDGGYVKSLAKLVKDAEDEFVGPATTVAQDARDDAIAARDAAIGAAAAAADVAGDVAADRAATEAARDTATGAAATATGAAGDAEDARAGAVTAREGAETARDVAIAAAGEAAVAVAGTEIDLVEGGWFTRTFAAGAISPTVTGWPAAGTVASFMFEMRKAGLATITWPASWKWAGGVVPAFSSNATDIIAVVSRDGGATVYAGLVFYGLDPE